MVFGTRVRCRAGCIEFYGGPIRLGLRRMMFGKNIAAMTLGHVILGQDPISLDAVREHELVHVRQYERWGPVFLPAYLACSLWLWVCRKDLYLDNPFEVEAYRVSDPGGIFAAHRSRSNSHRS